MANNLENLKLKQMTAGDIWVVTKMWKKAYQDKKNLSAGTSAQAGRYPDISGEQERFAQSLLLSLQNPSVYTLLFLNSNQPAGFIQWTLGERPYGKPHKIAFFNHVVFNGLPIGAIRKILSLVFSFLKSINCEQVETSVNIKELKRWTRRGWTPYSMSVHLPVEHYIQKTEGAGG